MRARCKLGQHKDRPMRGGNRVECTRCGDVFPCRHPCNHIDCILATGRELPGWVEVDPSDVEAIVAENLGAVHDD